MKKKTVKKLVLAKETVRRLEDANLTAIVGGWGTSSCNDFYPCPYWCPLN